MPVIVNGVEFSDADMQRELPQHLDAAQPQQAAMLALVLRQVLGDEARRLGISCDDEEGRMQALLAQVQVNEASVEDCRRYYDQHPRYFTVGEQVEAGHILFQVTPRVDLEPLRARAETVLANLLVEPAHFAERARMLSNCPSRTLGGQLGVLGRGDCVPEFERVLFTAKAGALHPHLVETRFGFHIVRVLRHLPGRLQAFEDVADEIAHVLHAVNQDLAWQHYLRILVGRARISGIALPGGDSPLLQ